MIDGDGHGTSLARMTALGAHDGRIGPACTSVDSCLSPSCRCSTYGLDLKVPMGEQPGAVVAPMTPSTDSLPHVLISDPNPVGRSRVSEILHASGIPADTAETAQQVLAATEADTVLLSLDGSTEEKLELIRKLRGLGPRRPAIVVMSGQSNALLPRALDVGADDYLITPARPEELVARLRVVADRRRLEAEHAMARTDPLTGLLNLGAFHQRLEEELKRSARHGRPLSLAVLDIDHLKRVNERYGRRAGDKALGAVADLARSHARETDVVGRVGAGSWRG